MIQVLTPRWPRGCSRVVLSIVLAAACSSPAMAQRRKDNPPKDQDLQGQNAPAQGQDAPAEGEEAARGPAKVKRDDEQTKKGAVDATKAQATDQNEQWKDPNAAAALENKFPELKSPPAFTPADR